MDVRAFGSLPELLERSRERYADRPALASLGATLSYRQLDALARDFAAFLQRSLGLRKGERVAIMLPNLFQYPVALFGALRAGLIAVNVNPLYTARELAGQLADSGAIVLVTLENFARAVAQALPRTAVRHVVVSSAGDLLPLPKRLAVGFATRVLRGPIKAPGLAGRFPFRRALRLGASQPLARVELGPEDTALLQYTGGTTGSPKGAILTHGNLLANVEQTRAWIGSALKEGEEIVVTALPLYHIFALTANLLVFLRIGGENLLVADPRDLRRLVATLAQRRFTAITGVNTLFAALLDAPGFAKVCSRIRGRLKVAVAGGMAVQRAVAERWQAATGTPLVEGYGLTEASPIVCANRFDAAEFTGKLGLPVPSTEVAILDEAGSEQPFGAVGEICVRGPQVMRGYWNLPAESAAAFTPDGWLRTGDLGRIDQRGYVEFAERRKDVIVVSGFKAYPTEIEDVAMLHPGVRDAGAVGIPDERSGEAVALFVVRRDPALTAQALLAHCSRNLTGYKLPRRIEFRDALPKSPLGKVLRRELREQIARRDG